MKASQAQRIEGMYDGFEMIQANVPHHLELHASGFPTDGEHLYGFRRSVNSEASDSSQLLNSKSINWMQATEGHGLYIANSPRATKVPGIHGDTMYGVRIPLPSIELLNTMDTSELERGQRMAAGLHRIRSVLPAVPNPGTKNWDRLYGNADVVSFPPMAAARFFIGRTVKIGDQAVPPRWAVVRNPSIAEIIAKK